MTEDQLLGPRAHGEPCGSAVLKAVAEDFQVDEVLDIPLSGRASTSGSGWKSATSTPREAAKRIARAAGVPLKLISYAGLKDRQALTRQWFSLHLPGKADPDLAAAEDDSLRLLQRVRHQRKLQRGAHSANGFRLRLTDLHADHAQLDARLERIRAQACRTTSVCNVSAMKVATSLVPVISPPGRAAGSAQPAFASAFGGAQLPVQSRAGPACRRWQLGRGAGRGPAGVHRQPQFLSRRRGGVQRSASGDPRPASHWPALG